MSQKVNDVDLTNEQIAALVRFSYSVLAMGWPLIIADDLTEIATREGVMVPWEEYRPEKLVIVDWLRNANNATSG